MGGNREDFTSEYEPRSTPLAPGQSTRQCVASHRRRGPFIISRMPWPKIEKTGLLGF